MNTPIQKTKITSPKRNRNAIASASPSPSPSPSPSVAKVILQKRSSYYEQYTPEEILNGKSGDKDVMSWIECLFDDECVLYNKDLFNVNVNVNVTPKNTPKPKKKKLGLFGSPALYPALYRDDTDTDTDTDTDADADIDIDMNTTKIDEHKKEPDAKKLKVTERKDKSKRKAEIISEPKSEPKKRKRRTKSKRKEQPSMKMKKNKSSKSSTFKSSRNKIPIRNKTELSLMKCLFGDNKAKEKNNLVDVDNTTIKPNEENMEVLLQKAAIAKKNSQDNETPSKSRDNDNQQNLSQRSSSKKAALLTKEEEIELSHLIQQGIKLQAIKSQYETAHDQIITNEEWATISNLDTTTLEQQLKASSDAKNKLITSNLGLVYSTIRNANYRKNGISEEELVQEGCLGLIRAAELFDPSKGFRFSTYATIWIKGTLGNSRVDQTISIPDREKRKWNKIQKAVHSLSPSMQVITKIENVQVIAEMVNMSTDDVQRITNQMNNMKRILSLDYKYTSTSNSGITTTSEEFTLEHKQKSPDNHHQINHLRHDVVTALSTTLSKREEQILRLRYGLTDDLKCRSIVECAKEMGMSRARVQQLAAEGLKKLREKEDVMLLQEYLAQI